MHLIPQRLLAEYTRPQLQQALLDAQHIMQRRKPESLLFDTQGDRAFEQAKRTVLMERMVLARFDNNYGFGQYKSLFDGYPNPLDDIDCLSFRIAVDLNQPEAVKTALQNMSLKIKQVPANLEHETIRSIHPIDTSDPFGQVMVIASSHALIEFIFQWCLHSADEIKDKQEIPSVAALLKKIEPIRYRLSYHSEYLPPVHYFTVEGMIINPRTGFPFNVPQEFFPRILQ
jgi:hypothetical protein